MEIGFIGAICLIGIVVACTGLGSRSYGPAIYDSGPNLGSAVKRPKKP